jgi:hypothetical protein
MSRAIALSYQPQRPLAARIPGKRASVRLKTLAFAELVVLPLSGKRTSAIESDSE